MHQRDMHFVCELWIPPSRLPSGNRGSDKSGCPHLMARSVQQEPPQCVAYEKAAAYKGAVWVFLVPMAWPPEGCRQSLPFLQQSPDAAIFL